MNALISKGLLVIIQCYLFHGNDIILFIKVMILITWLSSKRRILNITDLVWKEALFVRVETVRRNSNREIFPMDPDAMSSKYYTSTQLKTKTARIIQCSFKKDKLLILRKYCSGSQTTSLPQVGCFLYNEATLEFLPTYPEN